VIIESEPQKDAIFGSPPVMAADGYFPLLTALGLGVALDWEAGRVHEQMPYTRTYQPSLWQVDGTVADC